MFGLQLPLTRKLWVTLFETLQIKLEVKYFIKKSSCVFLCVSFITASLSSCVCLLLCLYDAAWCCRWLYNSTPSLPLLPGPLWLGVVAPDRALSVGWVELAAYFCWNELFEWAEWLKIEMFFTIKPYFHLNCVLMLDWIVWNRTVFRH